MPDGAPVSSHAGCDAAYSGKRHLCYNERDISAHGFEILSGKPKDGHDIHAADAATEFLAHPHDKPFLLVVSFQDGSPLEIVFIDLSIR